MYFRTRKCCAGDRRQWRKQGAGAGPAAAECKRETAPQDAGAAVRDRAARGRFPYGSRPATGLFAGRGTDPQLPYEELLRRRPPPAAETGSRSRAGGRRVQAGNPRRRMRVPRLVTGRRAGDFVRAIKQKPLKSDVLTSDFGGFSFAFTLHTSVLPHFLFQINDADKK